MRLTLPNKFDVRRTFERGTQATIRQKRLGHAVPLLQATHE